MTPAAKPVNLKARLAALAALEENHLFDFYFSYPHECLFHIDRVMQGNCDAFRFHVDLRTHIAMWQATTDGKPGILWQPIDWITLSGSPGDEDSTLNWRHQGIAHSLFVSRNGCHEDYDRFHELAMHFDPPF